MSLMMAAQRHEAENECDSKLHSVSGELLVQAPADFQHTLSFMGGGGSGEQRLTRSSVSGACMHDGRPVVFELIATDDPERLAYRLHTASNERGRPLSFDARVRLLRRLRFQFGLDDDLEPFYAIAYADRAFSRVVTQLYGMHHVKFPSPFEIACGAVLAQHTSTAAALHMKRAFLARFGASLEVHGHVHWAFPEASTLAHASPAAVAEVVRDPKKADAIAALARAFVAMPDDFLRTAPYAEAEAWLRALPMIGESASTFILFRGLGRMDRFAVPSAPLVDAVKRVYHAPYLSEAEALGLGDRYGEWKGYWALYLRASDFVATGACRGSAC